MVSIAASSRITTCRLSSRYQSLDFGGGFAATHSLAWQQCVPIHVSRLETKHLVQRACHILSSDGGGDNGDGHGRNGGGGGGDDDGGSSGDNAYGKAGGVSVFANIWARYMEMLEDYPLIIKAITAGVLNFFADYVCQVVFEKVQQVDIQRLLSFTAVGLFMSGPGLHFWYGLLPKLVTVPGFPGLLLRLAADQVVFTPLGVGCLFVALCIFEGRQQEIEMKLKKDWLPLVIANWKVWIPFQLINFGLIPPQLQVAATSLMGVAWSIFISFIGHK